MKSRTSRTRIASAAGAGLIALNAYAGGIGLTGGGIDMGPTITDRFPWDSPVLAGSSLVVVVALPMTVTAYLALRGDRRWSGAAVVAGALLVGWIVVQVAVIRTFSWMQPVSAAAGLAVLAAGWRARRRRVTPDSPA